MEAITDIKSEILCVASAITSKQHEIDALIQEKAELEQRKSALEYELDDMINAPPPDGSDLTLSLPDELLIKIVLLLSVQSIFTGPAAVCRKWRRLAASRSVSGQLQRDIQLIKFGSSGGNAGGCLPLSFPTIALTCPAFMTASRYS